MRAASEQEKLVWDLRTRADIRRKATCRGPDDRLANQLDAAANEIERLQEIIDNINEDAAETDL